MFRMSMSHRDIRVAPSRRNPTRRLPAPRPATCPCHPVMSPLERVAKRPGPKAARAATPAGGGKCFRNRWSGGCPTSPAVHSASFISSKKTMPISSVALTLNRQNGTHRTWKTGFPHQEGAGL